MMSRMNLDGGADGAPGLDLAAVGSLFGPAGGVVGGVVKALGGMFGGPGTPYGSNEFDGLHSPTLPPIAASSMHKPEADIYAAYARGLGISVEEVGLLLQQDADYGGHDIKYVIDAWRNTNLSNARTYLRIYNERNPLAMIREGVKGPAGAAYAAMPAYSPAALPALPPSNGFGGGSPFVAASANPLPASNAFLGMSKEEVQAYINGILGGAKKGAVDVFTTSDLGHNVQSQGAAEWAKTNALALGLGGVMVLGLAIKAFTK